ncbi:MAG: glycoside hydrolase family 16 protein [Prolixibacteraceae bacterium]|nr:glycoside hydrolase family 16 protein [Prolixibacteraceae bacterium]MBN2648711.1 glycoside hydrolase family 16 protein [Prolixibacteraceae bacterium]
MIFGQKMKNTDTIELQREQLWSDYQTYNKVEGSDKLNRYLTLKERVESVPFTQKKKEIETLKFKKSPEEKVLKQYGKFQKNKKIERYFFFIDSSDYKRFFEIEEQKIILELEKLEHYVKKGSYKQEKHRFEKATKDGNSSEQWQDTEAYAKNEQYENLKRSPDVLFYKRTIKSAMYKNYLKVKDSSLLNRYEDLNEEVNSEPFKERVEYLKDEKRYEKTEDYQLLKEFQDLDADPEIQLYMRYNDTDDFSFFREWTMSYEEQFDTIDQSIWDYIPPIAQKGPGKNFSIKNQLHYANKLDNFDTENSLLTLETKKEDCEGLYWDEKFGFVARKFHYVSGILQSSKGFEQQYGKFQVKLKASKVKGVVSSVSLVNESEDICIRIFSGNGNVNKGGLVIADKQSRKLDCVKLKYDKRGYIIVSLSWTPDRLEWTVNERLMGVITHQIPHVPLQLRIESEVIKDTSNLPHRLDIDWIKCYRKN